MSDELHDLLYGEAETLPAELELKDPRRQKFVEEYIRTGNGAQSAITAGYSAHPESAKSRAWNLLQNEDVKLAIAQRRKALAERSDFDEDKAMQELNDAILFARETKNATAVTRALELKMKMHGLLIERHDVRTAGLVQLVINQDDF